MPFLKQVKPLWDRSTMTLAELAEQCNISESSASRYLNGKISPPADVAERILEVLGAGMPPETAPEKTEKSPESPHKDINQVILQIREIYQAQIATLQANYTARLAAIQAIYDKQITDLKRDKYVLFGTVIVLIGMLLYFILDGLHGDWGLIRYAMINR